MTLSRAKLSNSNVNHNTNGSSNGSTVNNNFMFDCADCSSTNAQWASLNHGVLICDECCLAHRSLGRCISIIKSLRKSYWPQSLIDTLYELVRNSSNHIWESNLNHHSNDSSLSKQLNLTLRNTKKPSSKDARAYRLNYIRAKYENLAFISRGKYSSIEELNQQLLASVKTNNYEQTLRILSQGADANYRNQEDGLLCLHTAVLHNQIGQIELLCLYGAEVTGLDRNGLTPYELAKLNNYSQIADRLLELQFELTDEISHFLCNKRPDHKSGQHFYVPDLSDSLVPCQEETTKNAMLKIQELPDHLFEELAKDIYDEMDRRQIETIWKCTVPQNLANEAIPFLIIKSCFTQTRNQLRQKLARFNTNEFSGLLIEILNESKRRYYHNQSNESSKKSSLNRKLAKQEDILEEDDPLYDKVPSDEDYASVASESSSIFEPTKTKSSKQSNDSSNETTNNKKNDLSSPLTVSLSSSPINRSTKNTPSPSSTKFCNKEHKVLHTNFDKPPAYFSQQQQSQQTLVAHAESALNSIINSLNQIDYSHLNSNQSQSTLHESKLSDLNNAENSSNSTSKMLLTELKNEKELMQAMIERLMEENAQLRAEKMLFTANQTEHNNSFMNSKTAEELNLNLYSTVKNKKFSTVKENYTFTKSDSNGITSMTSSQTKQSITNKKQNENTPNDLVYVPVQQLTKSPIINYDLNENSNDRFNFEQQLKIVEENIDDSTSNTPSPSFKPVKKASKLDIIKQQLVNKQDRAQSLNSKHAVTNNQTPLQHLKLSPSKSMTNYYKSPTSQMNIKSPLKQTNPSIQSDSGGSTLSTSTHNTNNSISNNKMPTKDSVIKKMKKITKAVQELFKATKESEFGLFKTLCERVNHSVNEMIILFPQPLNSQPIQENLQILIETSRNLIELIKQYQSQIESFAEYNNNDLKLKTNDDKQNNQTNLSNSSSSSSALSCGSGPELQNNPQQDNPMLKNMIVSNLVTYSYEIAYTVKRIVCIMGADNLN